MVHKAAGKSPRANSSLYQIKILNILSTFNGKYLAIVNEISSNNYFCTI